MNNPHQTAALKHITDSRLYSGEKRSNTLALANAEATLAIAYDQQTANYIQLLEALTENPSLSFSLGIGRTAVMDLLRGRLSSSDEGEEG